MSDAILDKSKESQAWERRTNTQAIKALRAHRSLDDLLTDILGSPETILHTLTYPEQAAENCVTRRMNLKPRCPQTRLSLSRCGSNRLWTPPFALLEVAPAASNAEPEAPLLQKPKGGPQPAFLVPRP
jgi:hypothetical protein